MDCIEFPREKRTDRPEVGQEYWCSVLGRSYLVTIVTTREVILVGESGIPISISLERFRARFLTRRS